MELCGVWANVSILLVVLAAPLVLGAGEPNVMADYCEDATFQAQCSEDEVVVMKSALYGRMRSGECLSGEYGSMGCNSDVMRVMDRWCSGRQKCEVNVRDLVVKAQGKCTEQLRGYLQANYTCQRVVRPFGECCRDSKRVIVKAKAGYLASSITDNSGCGSIDCPWYIEAAKGQRVNITLFDFGIPSMPRASRAPICHVYAIIKEQQSTMTVCAGDDRVKQIHTTTSNSVEIRVVTKKRGEEDLTFMIKYEATGCPDIQAPPNGKVERLGNRATISCHGDGASWQVVCRGSKWTGSTGRIENCSASVGSVQGIMGDIFTLTPDISIVIIIIVAMIIAIVILMVGVFCLRRRWLQNNQLQNNHQKRPLPNPLDDRRRGSGYIITDNKSSLRENTYPREHNYFRTWELQRHPARVGIPNELPVDNQQYSPRYVDHIYESPTFGRREMQCHEDGTQYFELDPDAEPFYPGAPGAPGPGVSMRPPTHPSGHPSAHPSAHSSAHPSAHPSPMFLNNSKQQRCSFPESSVVDHKSSNIGSFSS